MTILPVFVLLISSLIIQTFSQNTINDYIEQNREKCLLEMGTFWVIGAEPLHCGEFGVSCPGPEQACTVKQTPGAPSVFQCQDVPTECLNGFLGKPTVQLNEEIRDETEDQIVSNQINKLFAREVFDLNLGGSSPGTKPDDVKTSFSVDKASNVIPSAEQVQNVVPIAQPVAIGADSYGAGPTMVVEKEDLDIKLPVAPPKVVEIDQNEKDSEEDVAQPAIDRPRFQQVFSIGFGIRH